MHYEVTRKVKPLPNFIYHMHMKVNSNHFRFFRKLFFQVCHHLLADSVLPVGLKDYKSKDVGVQLILKILESDGIAPNNDIVIESQLGELRVLSGNLDVEARGVLNGKRIKVELAKYIDILVVDVAHGYG